MMAGNLNISTYNGTSRGVVCQVPLAGRPMLPGRVLNTSKQRDCSRHALALDGRDMETAFGSLCRTPELDQQIE